MSGLWRQCGRGCRRWRKPDCCHPARAGEVAVVHNACTLGLPIRIEVEDDLDCLFPVRALFVRVEQAQIGGEMPLVIGGQLGAVRRAIFEGS